MDAAPMLVLRRLLPQARARRWRTELDRVAAARSPRPAAVALTALDAEWQAEMLRDAAGAAASSLRARLGPAWLCNLDQCWARWQAPPARRPPGHHPHSWHQDGALGHDFTRPDDADGGLLSMCTLWLALDACGEDAPGLEWSEPVPDRLLQPAELEAHAVSPRHAQLQPGDALLFQGALLHRTQAATPAMTGSRWSVEFRFFDAVPARLAGQRFVVP